MTSTGETLIDKEVAIAELSNWRHLLYKVHQWSRGSSNGKEDKRSLTIDAYEADLITSALADEPGYHSVMLDLDVPAVLVPSTTKGHSHLYVDVKIPWEKYSKLLDALADCNIIETGYASISKRHCSTSLRLPWIKKKGRT